MELLLVRHAEPRHERVRSGAADPGLTGRGAQQAQALADWFAGETSDPLTRVYASPMRRAQETAAVIANRCAVELRTDDRLAEFDQGSTSYIPLELVGSAAMVEVSRALVTGVWGDHRFDVDEFEGRVAEAFRDIVAAEPTGRVAVVCHGGVLNSFVGGLLGRPRGGWFEPRYTSVCRLTVDDAHVLRVTTVNEMPHAALLK